jgi:Zn-dependent protease/CBS domain-containing protein
MFTKRFNIFSLAGIKIGIDLSWFFIALLLSWTLAAEYFPSYHPNLSPGVYWLMGILGMLGLFICVVLHELGHALVAKHFNLPIEHITLFIFGGVAEIKKEPQGPKVEFLMAIAGPVVSLFLSICMFFLTRLGDQLDWPVPLKGVTGYLAVINLVIVIFNLIPAFPLDGGRIFRAILWWKKNLGWATKISSRIGSGFGFFLILLGIFSFFTGNFLAGVWFAILGMFLQKAASSAYTQFYIGQGLHGEKVLKFMKKDPIYVSPDVTVKEFIDRYIYESHHHLYPVVEGKNLVGYISLKEIKLLPQEKWKDTLVQQVMVPRSMFKTVSPDTRAVEAFNLMNESGMTTLLVVESSRLIGILTIQDLLKLISLKLELEDPRK